MSTRTMTVARESFAFTGSFPARSTEPEVFTFERVPAVPSTTAVRSCAPLRPRRRAARVMYPPTVRMHLPPPERTSRAKLWLLALCALVLWQVCTEEPCLDLEPAGAPGPAGAPLGAADPQGPTPGPAGPQEPACAAALQPAGEERILQGAEQSAGKSYMVALLVYHHHRLGNDS